MTVHMFVVSAIIVIINNNKLSESMSVIGKSNVYCKSQIKCQISFSNLKSF